MTKRPTPKPRRSIPRGRTPKRNGDIPPRAMHTYRTTSCAIPDVTDQCVVRALQHNTIVAQPTVDTKLAINYSLSGSATTSGTWDQYKILAVRVTITPDQNAIGLFTNSTTAFTPLYNVIDFDDSTNLSNATNAQQYSNVVVLNAGESCERVFRPRIALAAYSGTFTGFANVPDQWIDSASTTVQHYGMKFLIPGVTAAQTLLPSWQITTEYFIAFRKNI